MELNEKNNEKEITKKTFLIQATQHTVFSVGGNSFFFFQKLWSETPKICKENIWIESDPLFIFFYSLVIIKTTYWVKY